MKPALIFDLDGTLWDASEQITESWRIVGRKYFGPSFQLDVETVRGYMGKTMKEIGAALTPEGKEGAGAKEFIDECFAYETVYLSDHPGVLFPGELETLNELKKDFDLFIASNCQAGYIETFLPLAPGIFTDHKCWSDTHKDKEHTIRLLMDIHGLEDAIYIGDTTKDETAARKAGIRFVHASYGFGKAESPDASYASFEELPRVLRALCLR